MNMRRRAQPLPQALNATDLDLYRPRAAAANLVGLGADQRRVPARRDLWAGSCSPVGGAASGCITDEEIA